MTGLGWWRQRQAGGNNSNQIQAGNDANINNNYYTGVKADEVVRIFNELMRPELEKYTEHAKKIVESLALELLENYMFRQNQIAPEYASAMQEPRMQRALQSAQIEYATSGGDVDLGSVLVDLVVDLSQRDARSIYSTSVAEAIAVAPKLTAAQMNALSVVYCVKMTTYGWSTPEEMYAGLRKWILPFLNPLPDSGVDYRHMQGVGVSWIGFTPHDTLAKLMLSNYPGLFANGLRVEEIPREILALDGVIIDALREPSLKQLSILTKSYLQTVIERNNFTPTVQADLGRMQVKNLMQEAQVREDLLRAVPELGNLFDDWESTNLREIEISTVGMVLANANLRTKVEDAPILTF